MMPSATRIPILLSLLCILLNIPRPGQAQPPDYETCTKLAQTNPQEALRMADRWRQAHDHPSAYHCRALALFALTRYEEAAKALETLSFVITEKNLPLWSSVIRQAAKSWRLAEDNAKAIVVLSKGIDKTADMALSKPVIAKVAADMLLDRSALYQQGGRELVALQDLDQAISLMPKNPSLLIARARLLLSQDETALARQDLQAAATINPDHPELKQLQNALPD